MSRLIVCDRCQVIHDLENKPPSGWNDPMITGIPGDICSECLVGYGKLLEKHTQSLDDAKKKYLENKE